MRSGARAGHDPVGSAVRSWAFHSIGELVGRMALESLEGERGTQAVPAEPFEAFAISAMNENIGVKREPLKVGTAPPSPAQAVHLKNGAARAGAPRRR